MHAHTPSVTTGDIWWHHFWSKGPTRVDIVQLPVAHTQGNPFRGTSGSPVGHVHILYYYYCSSTKCTGCACARDHFQFRSGHFRLHMRSLPVAPQPQIWLELYPYTTDTHRVTPVTNPLSCYSRHKPSIVLLSLQTLSCYSRYKPSVVLLLLQTLLRVTPVTNPPSCYSRYKPSDKSWMRKERIRLWLQQTEHIQNINSNKILEDIDIANIYIFDCFFLCLYQSIDGL